MANLGNLIVRGVTRILGDAYANKFIGNLQGNADTATSAIKASTADSATNATSANKASIATAVQDYGTSSYREIKIGYLGSELSSSDITHAVGFTDNGTKIKNISKNEFRNWLATASGTWPITVSNSSNSANATNADTVDGYHASSFSLSTHTHTFKLGNTTITTNGGSYSSIAGPFNIYTNSNAANAFSILRDSGAEGVQHWVDDGKYHIDYTNDETSSSIDIRIINTDTESGNKTNTTDYHYYLDCYGDFYPGSNNTGSIGISGHKWANMYATTFHGSLDGNAATATKATQDGNGKVIADTYLPLSGGTLTGSVTMRGVDTNLIRDIVLYGTSGWARSLIELQVDGVEKFAVSAYGIYTAGASDNGIYYGYIGCNPYNGLNLRISDTSLTWGDNSILHAGNYNSYAPKLDGTGASGTWGIDISGNAATATNAENATNASAVNGVSLTWSGEITSSQWIAAWESGTSIKPISAYNTFISMCSYLDEGSSDVTDGTMFITSYATDNGFADPNGKNKPYKRKASLLWNYINNKCSSIYATQSWVHSNFYTCYESNNRYIQSETDPIWTADKVNYYTKTECNNKFQLKGAYLTEQNLQGYATTTWVNSNYYTCSESDGRYIQSETDPVWTAAKGNYYTKTECNNKFQPKGTYLTEQNLQGYATQEWVRGEEYLYRSGGTMDARAEIGITTKLFIGNSTSPDTCYTKFNCILHGGGDESNPNWIIRDNGYAEFKSSVSANAFYASSDIRLKNILDDINIDFDKLKLIPKKYYTWKGSDILQLGTIAQDIQKIYPEVVSKNENGYLSVDYSKLSIIALAAIDKLNERIKELECQIKL